MTDKAPDSGWHPWIDAAPTEESGEFIAELRDVVGPPCGGCAFWAPRRWYEAQRYVGVICCHAVNMLSDFSCYKPRFGVVPARAELAGAQMLQPRTDGGMLIDGITRRKDRAQAAAKDEP